MPDETSSLLQSPRAELRTEPGNSRAPPRRPPLYSIPSTQSLRTLKGQDPVVDEWVHANGDEINVRLFERRLDLYAYAAYYLPILSWLPAYDVRQALVGDLLAGLSMALFQIPLVMSFATSLAHLPPIMGLYSIIIGACVYSIFGCVPILVVGAAPSTALIYGQTIEFIRNHAKYAHFSEAVVSSAISASVGGILLAGGLLRFGFLDGVLSRALLKGFIAAMGFIMIINELAAELGLVELSLTQPHSSTIEKFMFIARNYRAAHVPTFLISSITLTIVMSVRTAKNVLVNKYGYKNAIYVPELLLMVTVATFLCGHYKWYDDGVEVVGNIAGPSATPRFVNPFQWSKVSLYKETFTTAFLCTILGYFDSTTATKALSAQYNYQVSSNRELIALGSTNFVVSLVSGLPAFGAFGRSKINMLAGATTPMAGLIMAATTVVSIIYLLPLLYYLPECVLALTTTIIGITVIQEVPGDLKFFWDIQGYDELLTFGVIFSATILWSTQAGVTLGVLVAVVRVIKNSTRSQIQILGRIPHTTVFRNADELIEESFVSYVEDDTTTAEGLLADKLDHLIAEIEEIEGVIIIKIPEPLNFANVGDLRNKLTRIEKYGSILVHPSQPTRREFNNKTIKFIIFDCKGMTAIDSSATQVLFETIRKYTVEQGISVSFSRVPLDKTVRNKFSRSGITRLINANFDNYSSTRVDDASLSTGMGPGFFLSIEKALKAVDLQV